MIKIAGAGLSGLTCALNLAKYGKEVAVLEKQDEIGAGHGRNILAFRNYDLERDLFTELGEAGIENLSAYPIYTIKKFSPMLECYEVSAKEPLFYDVVRGRDEGSIEKNLYASCIKRGVEFSFGKAASEKEVDVVATGARNARIMGCGAAYEGANAEDNTIYLFYDNRYAPDGYVYVAPCAGWVAVCAVCFDPRYFNALEGLFERMLSGNKVVSGIIDGACRLNDLKGFADYGPSAGRVDGRYYLGEAAGFLEASKGFGMKYAILSGYLAARAMAKNEDYPRNCKERFGKELSEGMAARRMFRHMTNEGYEDLIRKSKAKAPVTATGSEPRLS